MLMDKLRKLFSRQEIPQDARDLVRDATEMSEVLVGLDELITRNEMAVSTINGEIEALEEVESTEMGKVRGGELPERSKNNVLRRIQRLRDLYSQPQHLFHRQCATLQPLRQRLPLQILHHQKVRPVLVPDVVTSD